MQDGRTKTHANLWHITHGQRLRYLSATAATGVSSGFMLLAPLVGMYAIDVIVERDFDKGSPWLVAIARSVDQADPFLVYLAVSALAGLLLASVSALFMYFRGRWSAIATEAIARRLRDALFHRLHHLPAKFFGRSRYRRPRSALQFRRGDRARLPRHERRRDRPFHPPDRRDGTDPVLARCPACGPEPVPDAVHHRRRVSLLQPRQAAVQGRRRSRREADGRPAGEPDRHPGRARLRARRARNRPFRHMQPGVPEPPLPVEQARSAVLGHQRFRLARPDQRRGHRSRYLPRPRHDQCRRTVRVRDAGVHGDSGPCAA